jgi:hypothetical protein
MVADVLGVLRPLATKRLDGLEDVAARMAAGATVPPDEVLAVLDRCRCGADDLQAAVDRHARVAEIRRAIADADPKRKRLAAIHADLKALAEARAAAQRKENDAIAAHWEEEMTLRHGIDAVDRMAADLMKPVNLPPTLAEKLVKATARLDDATAAMEAARVELKERQRRLAAAEIEHEDASERARRNDLNKDIQEYAERMAVAVKARSGLVCDSEKAMDAAQREHEGASTGLDAVRASIEKQVK